MLRRLRGLVAEGAGACGTEAGAVLGHARTGAKIVLDSHMWPRGTGRTAGTSGPKDRGEEGMGQR